MTTCNNVAEESLVHLPVSLRRLELRDCLGIAADSLAHVGRLSALEHLALVDLPANGDDGMQQLAPQLHARLSGLYFTAFRTWTRWVSVVCPCACSLGTCARVPPQ
jgi:hypothetical protein